MALFHDEEDDPVERVPGLPGPLPEGETIVWRGRPNAAGLIVHAFHVRFVAGYFAALSAWAAVNAVADGANIGGAATRAATMALWGTAAIGILSLIGFAMARSAVFTVTTRRIVIRHGVAIPKFINLPFAEIAAVARAFRGNVADVAINLSADGAPYLHLWPFARPLKVKRPTPLLRSLSVYDADAACAAIMSAMKAYAPERVRLDATDTGRPSEASDKAAAVGAYASQATAAASAS